MKWLAFLLSLPLLGASLVINSGSATDQYFVGGTAFPSGAVDDTTLRFGTFQYKIPVADGVPYIIKFIFFEPSQVPPARAFSITINDQLVYPRIAMGPGSAPFSRSVVVMGSEGMLNISFQTIIRSAVVSSIEITPIFQILGASLPTVTEWQSCHGSGVLAGPVGDGVLVGAIWPGLIANPPGWNCDGLQFYRFRLKDGTEDGPYVAVKMPADFVPSPTIWTKQ